MAQRTETGFAEVNGGHIYYEIAGTTGFPLVLLHEGIGDCRMYDDQFDAFAESYRTIRYDMRGYGKSSVPTAPFSYSEDLHGLLNVLGVNKAHLLGMSMGGAAALDFALRYPEMVRSLVLAGSALSGFNDPDEEADSRWQPVEDAERAGDLERQADLMVQIWAVGEGRRVDQVPDSVRRRIHDMTMQHLLLSMDESLEQEPDHPAVERLDEIHVPTLVIIGANDVSGIRKIADVLAHGIAGAREVVMADSAHVPNMEHPGDFNHLVLDFLATVPLS